MKNLVIILGTIILGLALFNMILGDENSLKSASKDVMVKSIVDYGDK